MNLLTATNIAPSLEFAGLSPRSNYAGIRSSHSIYIVRLAHNTDVWVNNSSSVDIEPRVVDSIALASRYDSNSRFSS